MWRFTAFTTENDMCARLLQSMLCCSINDCRVVYYLINILLRYIVCVCARAAVIDFSDFKHEAKQTLVFIEFWRLTHSCAWLLSLRRWCGKLKVFFLSKEAFTAAPNDSWIRFCRKYFWWFFFLCGNKIMKIIWGFLWNHKAFAALPGTWGGCFQQIFLPAVFVLRRSRGRKKNDNNYNLKRMILQALFATR